MSLGAERVLTQRELNRAVLDRQLLLARRRDSLPRGLERVAGLQAQYAPSMYIGLWSRLQGFERHQLTSALEQRSVVQGTLMRVTIHLVSAGDYWPFAIAIRQARRERWLRARREMSALELRSLAAKARRRLADGPLPRAELIEGMDSMAFNGIGMWLDLVRVPPAGTWERRRADIYGTAETWTGPPSVTPAEGLEHLIRRYLQGFGPAAPGDIANWAGMPVRPVGTALERLELRRFRDEGGGLLVDLPRLALPAADTPAPVRYLPTWDATLLVHCRRALILPEEHRPKIFHTKAPQSFPTFLVDGAVAGTWRHEGGRIELQPFGRLARADRDGLDEEGRRLAAFHA
ncbi:MAG: winged helix DNA-binding domain-containing protein [Thermoleophilaceae bacterium]|nr:winged helix DNA-binding domain-containing protein [Thermoleophilaceae bacterium]